jgi:hypothetical protein
MAKVSPPSSALSQTRTPWFILLSFGGVPALLAGMITYGTAPPPAPPSYRAEATLVVHRFSPGVFIPGSQKEGQLIEEQFLPHPQAMSRLLTTPDVAETARGIYKNATGLEAPSLQEVLSGISASNEVLADTAVRRDVSPLIQVTFQHGDQNVTLDFLKAWTQACVQKVGTLLLSEIKRRLRNLDLTETQILEAYRKKNELLIRIQADLQPLMAEWETLHGMPKAISTRALDFRATVSDSNVGGSSMDTQTSASPNQGLLDRIRSRRLEEAWNKAVEDGRLSFFESELQSTSTRLIQVLSRSEAEYRVLVQEIQILDTQLRGLAEAKARLQVQVGAAESSPSSSGAYSVGPELRVVAAPTLALQKQSSRPPTFWALLAASGAGAVGLLLGLGIRREGQGSA